MIYEVPILLPPDENRSDPPNWRHWTWWLRPIVALPLMLFVLLLLSPFLVRAWHLAKVPDIADPFDVDAFLSEAVDDKDNAFVDYEAAAKLLVPIPVSPKNWKDEVSGKSWDQASPTVRRWLDANQPALERWRLGTEKADALDGESRHSFLMTSRPNVQTIRDLLALSCLQGERAHAEGRIAEAWQWYRGLIRFGHHFARQRTDWSGRVFGDAFHKEAAKRIVLWASDPRTNAELLQSSLKQLTEDARLRHPFVEYLKGEYCVLQKLERFSAQRKPPSFIPADGSSWNNSRLGRYCLAEPELSFRWNKLVIENWLSGSDVPRRLQHRITGRFRTLLDVTAPGSHLSGKEVLLLDRFGGPNPAEMQDKFDTELARQETLRLTLACQLWFRQQGTFPDALENFVPDVITELPIDSFSKLGKTIRFQRHGDEMVVYSVGLDETDDLGRVNEKDRDIGYRIVPPRIREQASEQKAVDEP
ncbi:MAG: hypothetical protein FD138_2276 [Planctomycetota bacterium]|nr:MAG: hypothetical protein FD138_2276 [Planctomycetota bacterium]